MHKYCHFTHIYDYFAVPAASPAPTHPSIKESTKGGRPKAAPPPSFMDGGVGAGEAAGTAKY